MEEEKRELATNRLLDVIRNGKSGKARKKPDEQQKKVAAEQPYDKLTPTQQRLVQPPLREKETADPKGVPKLLDRLMAQPDVKTDSAPAEEPTAPPEAGQPEKIPIESPVSTPLIEPVVDEQPPPPGIVNKLLSKLPVQFGRPKAEKSPSVTIKGKAKRVIAVDIGTSSVKVVEILKTDSACQFVKADSRSIPSSLRKNESSLNILQLKILRDLLPPQRIKGAKIHFVLSDKAMQFKRVGLPVVPVKERENAIKFQIKKELPFPLESCEISYRGWNPKINARQEIEVLAADNRYSEKIIQLIDELGILPHHISVIPASLRFLVKGYAGLESSSGAVAVVDVGAVKTTITILENDKLVLCRTIATGGDDFTQVLQGMELGPGGTDLSEVEAEKFKIETGLPQEGDPENMRIHIQFRPVVERISTEINRSLDFYRRERPEGDLQKVIMIGGGAKMLNLPKFFSDSMGIEVVVGNPQDRIGFLQDETEDDRGLDIASDPTFSPAFAVALDDAVELNLLPQRMKNMLKMMSIRRTIPPVVLGLVALLITLYAMALIELGHVEVESDSIKGKIVNLDMLRQKFISTKTEFDQKTAELISRENDFNSVMIGIPDIPVYIKAFSNLVPPNIYLTRLHTLIIPEEYEPEPKVEEEETGEPGKKEVDMEKILAALQGAPEEEEEEPPPKPKRLIFGRVIEIEGNVYPMGSLTDMQLVNFVFALENSGFFREIAVDSAATLDDGRLKFKVICGI